MLQPIRAMNASPILQQNFHPNASNLSCSSCSSLPPHPYDSRYGLEWELELKLELELETGTGTGTGIGTGVRYGMGVRNVVEVGME